MFYKCPQFPVENVPLGMNMCWSAVMLASAPHSSISNTPSRATYFILFFPSEDIGWHLALVQVVRLLQDGALRGYTCPSFPATHLLFLEESL